MLTKHFYAVINAFAMPILTSGVIGIVPFTDVNGSQRFAGNKTISSHYPSAYIGNTIINGKTNGIVIGSGVTPATVDDYFLESQITTGFSSSIVATKTYENGTVKTNYDVTITNTSSTSISVGEIGVVITVTAANSANASTTSSAYCLLDRTVLTTPVVIAPEDFETIRYTVSLQL